MKSWDADKEYGFLAQDDGGADVFVHFSAIQTNGYRSLEVGRRVEFEATQGPKGPQADMVRPPAPRRASVLQTVGTYCRLVGDATRATNVSPVNAIGAQARA